MELFPDPSGLLVGVTAPEGHGLLEAGKVLGTKRKTFYQMLLDIFIEVSLKLFSDPSGLLAGLTAPDCLGKPGQV